MGTEESWIRKFLLPEKEVSLKLVFDNVRNYVIIGAFAAMARWFANGKVTAVPGVFTKPPHAEALQVLMWCSITIGTALFLLNVGQSYQIFLKLLSIVFPVKQGGDDRNAHVPWYIYGGAFLSALAFMAVVIVICSMLLMLAVYMVWFAATGTGR